MAKSGDAMDVLADATPGDTIAITTRRGGEELSLSLYVTDRDHTPPVQLTWGWDAGRLELHCEIPNDAMDAVEGLDWLRTTTQQVDIATTEDRPGQWSDPSIWIWDPVAEDGVVVEEHWTSLGTIQTASPDPDGGRD